MRGLLCQIYKCKLHGGGVYSKDADNAILVGEDLPQLFKPLEGQPVFRLVKRHIFNQQTDMYALPVDAKGDGIGRWCFSGTFLYTSDGRMPGQQPLRIHDQEFLDQPA